MSSLFYHRAINQFHMGVYGAILGGMELKAMELAEQMNGLINETLFQEFPALASYLESYSALDVHTMVRFGRWNAIVDLPYPKDRKLMLYRSASITYAKSLAHAALGSTAQARREWDRLESMRKMPEADERILHNNSVARLLAVDAVMARGEIEYREGNYEEAFELLRQAVSMQDDLNYDEPWGKMQPIRHALGGLLLEQGHVDEATAVFRDDLKIHPNNPWALVGLIRCLKKQTLATGSCGACGSSNEFGGQASNSPVSAIPFIEEISLLEQTLCAQQQQQWTDYDVVVPCECCAR
jgi:tetratricopeptide (TPR) repeat protein